METLEKKYYFNNKFIFTNFSTITFTSKYKCKFLIEEDPYCINIPHVYKGAPINSLENNLFYVLYQYQEAYCTYILIGIKDQYDGFNFYIIQIDSNTARFHDCDIFPLFYDHDLKDFYIILSNSTIKDYISIEEPIELLEKSKTTLENGFKLCDFYSLLTYDKALLYPLQTTPILAGRSLRFPLLSVQYAFCGYKNYLEPSPKLKWYIT